LISVKSRHHPGGSGNGDVAASFQDADLLISCSIGEGGVDLNVSRPADNREHRDDARNQKLVQNRCGAVPLAFQTPHPKCSPGRSADVCHGRQEGRQENASPEPIRMMARYGEALSLSRPPLDAPQFGSGSREQTGGLPMTSCVLRPRIKESPQPALALIPAQAVRLKKPDLSGRRIASTLTVTTALMVLFRAGQMFSYETASPNFRTAMQEWATGKREDNP
jgi:hypothetical protein